MYKNSYINKVKKYIFAKPKNDNKWKQQSQLNQQMNQA